MILFKDLTASAADPDFLGRNEAETHKSQSFRFILECELRLCFYYFQGANATAEKQGLATEAKP